MCVWVSLWDVDHVYIRIISFHSDPDEGDISPSLCHSSDDEPATLWSITSDVFYLWLYIITAQIKPDQALLSWQAEDYTKVPILIGERLTYLEINRYREEESEYYINCA